ncbi:phage tail protein [Laribacter hongkongensis]|uniref:phage tail protein n=1 Tax=Laribacter hongkongensis TaxID=168471 RepID=UPI001EFD8544|nr:phage tail protein [Laribacter hongkongensis]MCG9094471.1 phage tail protein [Laribacter hongkongensis]
MHRIDTSTKAPDLFGSGKHGFRDGNPQQAIGATRLNAAFFNAVQEELARICEAANVTLDAGNHEQVLTALRWLFLGKTAQAADSAKLEGHPASYFAKADDLAKAGSDPLLWPRTSPSRTHIQAGYAPLDGQELSRALYPDAWSAIQSGAVPVVTESEWQADPLKRGAWTYGNGTTTFRMPDWNGKSAGSKGALFVRGDGALSAGMPGLIQQDELRSHRHTIYAANQCASGSGSVQPTSASAGYDRETAPAGGTETRPLNVASVWVCRLFGAVTNPGSADAAQLATEVARLWAQKVELASFTGSNQLLAGNGYQKLPGGLIIQWGTISGIAYNATAQSFTFPIVFPGACLVVVSKGWASVGTAMFADINIHGFGPAGVSNYQASCNNGSGTINARWIALGY